VIAGSVVQETRPKGDGRERRRRKTKEQRKERRRGKRRMEMVVDSPMGSWSLRLGGASRAGMRYEATTYSALPTEVAAQC
jgi:hypothetical protein